MNCTYHAKNAISLICIAPHDCLRKLCIECLYEHGVDMKLTLPINNFLEQVNKKIERYNLADKQYKKTKKHYIFKQLISNLEITLKQMWEYLSQEIKNFDLIESGDQQYVQILNKNPSLAESSYTDLEKLVQFLNGRDWDTQNNFYSILFQNIKCKLEKEINLFSQRVKEQIKEVPLISNICQPKLETKEIKGFIWQDPKFIQTKFLITFKDNQEIQYIKDGQILRIDQFKDISKQPQKMNNLEQIKHLHWSGNYGQNDEKIGIWKVLWKQKNLDNVGGEYINGQKQGLWKELIKNYWSEAQVYEVGEYDKDKQIGTWKIIYSDNQIGGGEYNNFGYKQGKWIDIFENFFEQAQIIYIGEYHTNGIKIGRWDICWVGGQQIGGGLYDQEGYQKKIGKWVELDEGFWNNAQVTYNGEYNMNGMKVGRWDTMQQRQQIGGGQYDQDGYQKKVGEWVEIDGGYSINPQITNNGEYNANGMKVGRWDIMYYRQQIGGGLYDQNGNQQKTGIWIELDQGFKWDKKITYNGEYNINGVKVGLWKIMQDSNGYGQYKQIGGGSYDQEGTEKKIGTWVELDEGFYSSKQVTYNGGYNMNGVKVGRWDVIAWYYQIGGGSYDLEGNEKKIGNWVELDEGYYCDNQVTHQGEYNMNGIKIGLWNLWRKYKGENQLIGGGSYDQDGNQKKLENGQIQMKNFLMINKQLLMENII